MNLVKGRHRRQVVIEHPMSGRTRLKEHTRVPEG